MFETQLDFTDEQKQQILDNPEICEDLLFWFSCNLSEGWWSQKNYDFMMELDQKEITAIDWNF